MKALFSFLAVLGLAASAHAYKPVTAETDWNTIFHTANIKVDTPKITIENYFVTPFSLCVDGDVVKAEVSYCAEYKGGGGENARDCVRTAEKVIAKPIVYSDKYCSSWRGSGDNQECDGYTTYTTSVPLKYNIPVYHTNGSTENEQLTLLFKKQFVVPACR